MIAADTESVCPKCGKVLKPDEEHTEQECEEHIRKHGAPNKRATELFGVPVFVERRHS